MSLPGLSELFRDDAEIAELLEHYGLEVPENARTARKQLLDSVEGFGHARVLAMMFDYASGFARMASEIFDFCAESGVGIAGQIQIKTDDIFLRETELNSEWAFSGRSPADSGDEERTNALANELDALVERLNPSSFVREVIEVQDTSSGRLLLTSVEASELDAERRAYKAFTQRMVYNSGFSDMDIDLFTSLVFFLSETEATIAVARMRAA